MALFELRTYTLYVGKMGEAIQHYTELGWPALQKGGFDAKLVGYFTSDVGTINQLVQSRRRSRSQRHSPQSRAHKEGRGMAMAQQVLGGADLLRPVDGDRCRRGAAKFVRSQPPPEGLAGAVGDGFVQGIAARPDRLSLASSVIGLAHALDAKVVAEGIEIRADLEVLERLGCDHAQGFLLARPSPAKDVPGIHGRDVIDLR